MRSVSLFILVLMLGVLATDGSRVMAAEKEGAFLFIAPTRLIISPREKVSVMSVSNRSDTARRYDLMLVDQVMTPDGATKRVDNFDYSAKKMLRFVPRRFTLLPGEQQAIRVMVARPANLADGDYHSHLLFREVPVDEKDKKQLEADLQTQKEEKPLSFELGVLYSLAIPVIVQKGKIVADLNMGDPKLGLKADGKGRQLAIDFTRTGNASSAGKLTADYVQEGKPPVPVIQPQWVRLYHEVDKISKDIPLINVPKDAKGGKIVISLARDQADDSKTIKKEIAFN